MNESMQTTDEMRTGAGNMKPDQQRGDISTADIAYGQRGNGKASASQQATEHESLLPEGSSREFHDRWSDIQSRFVDEPKDAVGEADGLVAEVIQKLAQRFAEERQTLEGQWSKGTEVSTEDLRQALQHYRSFFQRLLAA